MTDIIPIEQTESTISTSRTFQEMLKIEHGADGYRTLSALLDASMPSIDKFAEDSAAYLAKMVVDETRDEQYFNPKYGKYKNFFTRNIYIDPQKKAQLEQERYENGMITSVITESTIKLAARGIQALANHCDIKKCYGEIYALLYSFARYDNEYANTRGAAIELAKIVHEFPLSNSDIKSIIKKYKTPMPPENLPKISALSRDEGNDLRENLAYILYSISRQKYGDNVVGKQQLLDYYNFLGYYGNPAEELIQENSQTYNTISTDQVNFLKISRSIITNIVTKVPEININRLRLQANEMAKYDPYSIRRKKAQNVAGGAGTTLAGIFSRRPDLVMQGASTALSQLKLENNDNAVEFLEKQFKNNGVDHSAFDLIFKQCRDISDKVKKFDKDISFS